MSTQACWSLPGGTCAPPTTQVKQSYKQRKDSISTYCCRLKLKLLFLVCKHASMLATCYNEVTVYIFQAKCTYYNISRIRSIFSKWCAHRAQCTLTSKRHSCIIYCQEMEQTVCRENSMQPAVKSVKQQSHSLFCFVCQTRYTSTVQ